MKKENLLSIIIVIGFVMIIIASIFIITKFSVEPDDKHINYCPYIEKYNSTHLVITLGYYP